MKGVVKLLVVLVVLIGNSSGQKEKRITEWLEVSRPEDGFSLEAPTGFRVGMSNFTSNKMVARGEFHSESDRFYIFIDIPKKPTQRQQVEEYLTFANQTASAFDLDGLEARRVEFADFTGFYHRVIFVQTVNRVFTLHTVSLWKDNTDAIRFLNSFRLQPMSVIDGAAAEPIFSIAPTPDVTTGPSKPQSRSTANGSGQGSGIGSGSPSTAPPTTSRVITKLSIHYKQKASYTDIARFYGIQGTVLLRVAFLASGEIGSVTKIRSLPFGLTESAIDAAKQMKFEPEMVNGVARNTTRPVSFTFNIY